MADDRSTPERVKTLVSIPTSWACPWWDRAAHARVLALGVLTDEQHVDVRRVLPGERAGNAREQPRRAGRSPRDRALSDQEDQPPERDVVGNVRPSAAPIRHASWAAARPPSRGASSSPSGASGRSPSRVPSTRYRGRARRAPSAPRPSPRRRRRRPGAARCVPRHARIRRRRLAAARPRQGAASWKRSTGSSAGR